MLKIDGTNITLTCGDSASINVSAKDVDGNKYNFVSGDQVKFTVKASKEKGDTALITKTVTVTSETEGDSVLVSLIPTDTSGLEFGKYYYDVQLTRATDSFVDTIIESSIFKVGVEIG